MPESRSESASAEARFDPAAVPSLYSAQVWGEPAEAPESLCRRLHRSKVDPGISPFPVWAGQVFTAIRASFSDPRPKRQPRGAVLSASQEPAATAPESATTESISTGAALRQVP